MKWNFFSPPKDVYCAGNTKVQNQKWIFNSFC